MATHTTYYNLTKPAQNDKVNIGVLNDNADIIDTALHNKVDSDDLTAGNVMMSDGVTSVEDVLDGLTDRLNLKYFDVSIPAGTTTYNYSADKPSDFIGQITAMNVGGDAVDVKKITNTSIIVASGATVVTTVRVLYIAS